MAAIRLQEWRDLQRDDRLKITAAYTIEFQRANTREALLNNQHQATALDRLEAFVMPLARGDRAPEWTADRCAAILATPFEKLIPPQLASYWFFLTANRKVAVRARLSRIMGELGCPPAILAMIERVS